MTEPTEMVSVRYMVDDVEASIDFYTRHFGFEARISAAPAFADIRRSGLRLLLSVRAVAGRPTPDGAKPGPGGWNRIHLVVDHLAAKADRLRQAGIEFRSVLTSSSGWQQLDGFALPWPSAIDNRVETIGPTPQ